jgi:hypothetical protein
MFTVPLHPQVNLKPRDIEVFKEVIRAFLPRDQFIAEWDDVVPFDLTSDSLRETILSQAPIELQIASLYSNPDYPYADNLKQKLIRMVKKFHIRMSIDMKQMTAQRLSTLPGFNVLTMTLHDWVQDHPEYSFLDDDRYVPDMLDTIEATYNYADIKTAYIAQMERFEYQNVSAFVEDGHLFDPNITFDNIMEFELAHPFGRQQVAWWEYHNYVNSHLLDYVLNLIRANDTESLHLLSVY